MAANRGPTLRAQWLGQQLRELREAAGLTLKETGDYLQRDASTVSRFEVGAYPARMPEVLALLDLFSVDDPARREALLELSRDVWKKGWWNEYVSDVDRTVIDYAWLESRADTISTFGAMLIPGLLQTRDYAETVMAVDDPAEPAEKIARWIELRMTRQQILDTGRPPVLHAVLDDAVLWRTFGRPDVMRAQLRRLADLSERPEIDIYILPAGAAIHAGSCGNFTIFDLPEPYNPIAYAELITSGVYVEGNDAARFAARFDRLRAASLNGKESAALLSEAAHRLTS